MCGRYGLFADLDDLGAQLGFDPAAVRDAYRPRWNIAPTAAALVVESGAGVRQIGAGRIGVGRVGRMVRWGGPAASSGRAASGRASSGRASSGRAASGDAGRGGRPRFNIRAETVAGWGRRRGNDWGYRRCLVPANGFYEWQAGPGGRRTPWWFQPADGGVMVMAGIQFGSGYGGNASCAVITGPANGLVEPVHHRMPVVLEPAQFAEWLDGAGAPARLLVYREWPEMTARAVSPAVNRAGNDGPHLIAALSGELLFGDGVAGVPSGSGRLF